MGKIIGIDLGTSTTEAAILYEGKPQMIKDSSEAVVIPSAVGIDENGEWIVGEKARAQQMLFPERTAIEVKRRIGTGEMISLGEKEYSPVELSAILLSYVKEYATASMGEDITRAVISVPAYFDDAQRRATMEAGKLAGFTVERIINEPTAAALSYGLAHISEESHILVYDLGGGTFDVTLLEMFDGVLDVKASSGDNQLGGKDFDEVLMDILCTRFMEKNKIDLKKDAYAMVRLKDEAEKCKIALSDSDSYHIELPLLVSKRGKPYSMDEMVTREEFEEATADLLLRTHRPVDTVLADGNISAEEIAHVILVGGSSRMPAVAKDIEDYLGITPERTVDPDYAVAEGASIQAGIIAGELSEEDSVIITDVNPFTLGIRTVGDDMYNYMSVIMKRNITVPAVRSERFSTHYDRQTAVEIEVFQGESEFATDNHYLGSFVLSGIPPRKAQKEKIDVEFRYDQNGVLEVNATVVSTGGKASCEINLSQTGHATGQKGIDAFDWKACELADDYRGIMRKTEKKIRELTKEEDREWDVANLEAIRYELAKAIVQNNEKLADESEEMLEHFMKMDAIRNDLEQI